MSSLGASLALVCVALIASLVVTAFVLKRARERGMIDVPNERSSHTVPTPRGGGLAIVAVASGGIAFAWTQRLLEPGLAAAMLAGGGAVATVGWLDDAHSLSARLRAAVHALAAAAVVIAVNGFPHFSVGTLGGAERFVQLGPAGWLIAVVFIVWMTNLFNFMDGIDGLAATYAALVFASAAQFIVGDSPGLKMVALASAGACGGFLVWNWAPARIFMGDVGSGFLGFVLASLAIASERLAGSVQAPAVLWIALLALFIADATVTLLRRVARGRQWYSPHREHAYQRLVQAGWSHAHVAVAVAAFGAVLGALVATASRRPEFTLPLFGVAAALAIGVYVWVERKRPMQ